MKAVTLHLTHCPRSTSHISADSPRNPRHGALLPGVPGEGIGDPAPAHTRAEEGSGAGGRPAVLARAAPWPPRGRPVTQHLRVLLLVLAEHLRHGDQGLDLTHLLADVHQLGQVRLADVVNCGQVSSRITLRILNSLNYYLTSFERVNCIPLLCLHLDKVCPSQRTNGPGTPPSFLCSLV